KMLAADRVALGELGQSPMVEGLLVDARAGDLEHRQAQRAAQSGVNEDAAGLRQGHQQERRQIPAASRESARVESLQRPFAPGLDPSVELAADRQYPDSSIGDRANGARVPPIRSGHYQHAFAAVNATVFGPSP